MKRRPKGRRILIIEDNEINLELARDLLTAYGYEVLTASDADTCWLQLKEDKPDLILMDLQLPGMDGYSLIREIKSRSKLAACPIVALTAYAMPAEQERAMTAGCQGIITKPIDTREFPKQVARYIREQEKEGV